MQMDIPTHPGQPGRYHVELSFAPSLALVTIVRRFVITFFDLVLTSPTWSSKLAVTVHELLENACKFSTDRDSYVRIDVHKTPSFSEVTIETRNLASSDNCRTLEALFAEMAAIVDPMTFYLARMEHSLGSPQSQLGLARVRAEADMALSYRVEGDRVSIVATTRLTDEASEEATP
jgi:hypothetical protein